jgi:hypothetical protein
MNNTDTKEIIKLLDSSTIGSLLRVYNIKYDSISFRLRCTRQNIVYKQKTDSYKDFERQMIYGLLQENGCNDTFIQIVHLMMKNQKKAGVNK